MEGVIVFSFLALGLKIWAFVRLQTVRYSVRQSTFFAVSAFMFVAYSQTVLEFVGYYNALLNPNWTGAFILIRLYHLTLVLLAILSTIIFRNLLQKPQKEYWTGFMFMVIGVFFVLLFSSDFIISGVKVLSYTFTRIRGPGYSIFSLLFMIGIIESIIISAHSLRTQKYNAGILLSTSSTLLFSAATIMTLMHFGVHITGTGIASMVFAIMLLGFSFVLVPMARQQLSGEQRLTPEHAYPGGKANPVTAAASSTRMPDYTGRQDANIPIECYGWVTTDFIELTHSDGERVIFKKVPGRAYLDSPAIHPVTPAINDMVLQDNTGRQNANIPIACYGWVAPNSGEQKIDSERIGDKKIKPDPGNSSSEN